MRDIVVLLQGPPSLHNTCCFVAVAFAAWKQHCLMAWLIWSCDTVVLLPWPFGHTTYASVLPSRPRVLFIVAAS